jgi:hypothetical protein
MAADPGMAVAGTVVVVMVMVGESVVTKACLVMLAAALLCFAAACDGAREVDYRPSRGISADIDATHDTGATSLRHGMTTASEPLGAMPWQLGQRHQGGP